MTRAPGPRNPWSPHADVTVDLPVILDIMCLDDAGEQLVWCVEATIDLVGQDPVLTQMLLRGPLGLDSSRLQRDFRWATPIEAVTRLAPLMIEQGLDPFEQDFPITGYPEVTRHTGSDNHLSDEFLEDIAREYLALGRGYSQQLAVRFCVSPRTVISWVEKARRRGILTATSPGRAGGEFVPRSARGSD